MRTAAAFTLLGASALALAACGDKQDAKRQDTAGGEILAGSISDDMLPYDTLRSQPPLAPKPTTGAGKPGQSVDDEETEGENGEAGPDAEAPAAPATPAEE